MHHHLKVFGLLLTWRSVYPKRWVRSNGEACFMANRSCRSSTLPATVNETTFDVEGITLYDRKIHCQPWESLSLYTSRAFVLSQCGKLRRHRYFDPWAWRDLSPCGALSVWTFNNSGDSPMKQLSFAHNVRQSSVFVFTWISTHREGRLLDWNLTLYSCFARASWQSNPAGCE